MPWGSLVLWGSRPSRWGHPCGLSYAPGSVFDQIEGFSEPLLPSHPWGSSLPIFVCTRFDQRFLIWDFICAMFLRNGVTEYSIAYILDRIEGISLVSLLVGLLVWVVCSFFGWCGDVCYSPPFPSFFFVCLYSAWLVAWLLRPCLA